MKSILVILLIIVTFAIHGILTVKKTSLLISCRKSLKKCINVNEFRIYVIIAPWQKKKHSDVTGSLRKTGLSISLTDNPVDIVKTEEKRTYYNLTDKKTGFSQYLYLTFFFQTAARIMNGCKTHYRKKNCSCSCIPIFQKY
jgi:hypothetical protein